MVASYGKLAPSLMKQIEQGALRRRISFGRMSDWMDYGPNTIFIKNDTRENLLGNRSLEDCAERA